MGGPRPNYLLYLTLSGAVFVPRVAPAGAISSQSVVVVANPF